ncbi:MAG TPA: hypothetical protein VJ954_00755, partial [Ignavibacteriaceae bacterium]|nr:hypothetical protein [Ignavibacteriaceae bacterium]
MTSLLRNINIIKGQKALGVSIWLRPDSEYEIHSVLVQTSKSKLHVEKKWSQSELNEFSSSFNHNVPVYLSLDGSGVLHKIVNSTDDNLLIESLLPGANIDDFIIQEVQLTGDKILVSIARREVVEAVTKKINDQGFYILKIFLGPLSITSVNELLESDQEISLPHYNISIIGKDINSIKKNETKQGVFSLSLESEEIEPDFVISFSNSLHHFTSCNRIKLNDDFTDIQSLNYRYKKLSQVVGSSVLILVFISLLINFFLFDYYHNKNL